MKLLQFFILLIVVGCSQPEIVIHPGNFLKQDDFYNVIIGRYGVYDSAYVLDKEEMKMFFDEWNNSSYQNESKMNPDFKISISGKNLIMLELFAKDGLIKFNSDSTFLLSDSNLLQKIWDNGNKLSIKPHYSFLKL